MIRKPIADAGADQNVNEGKGVLLDGSASTGDIATFRWIQTEGTNVTLSDSMAKQTYFTAPSVESGTFILSFKLTVKDNNGFESEDTVKITVSDIPPPVASFSAEPLSGNVPLTVLFSDKSQGNISQWEWDFGDGFKSTLQNPSHTYNAAGLYSISLTVKGAGGESKSERKDYITVINVPLKADFDALTLQGAAPLSVSFRQKSQGEITSFEWNFGDGKKSVLSEPVHIYESPGTYTVSLTLKGTDGTVTDTKTDYITVTARSISGRVTAEDTGAGLESCIIEVWSDIFLNSAATDKDGKYLVDNLPAAANITVKAQSPYGSLYYQQFYSEKESMNKADRVSLVQGSLADIDFILKKISAEGIKGRVHDGQKGIAGIEVNIFSESLSYGANTVTDENGNYQIIGLKQADDYIVSVWSDALNTEFYYAIPDDQIPGKYIPTYSVFSESRATRVSPADPLLSDIDIIVNKKQGGFITGHVYRISSGIYEPLSDVWVNAWSDGMKSGNRALTDKSGYYEIWGLDAVKEDEIEQNGYIVEIQSSNYPYQAYNKADTAEAAVLVGTGTSGMDFYLRSQGEISGRIMTPTGAAVSGAEIIAWSESDPLGKQGKAKSDENGNYLISALPIADDYLAEAFAQGYPVQYYNQKTAEPDADIINLTKGDARSIDFVLSKGGVIKGFVFGSQETGERRQEKGVRRKESGDRRKESGVRSQESGANSQQQPITPLPGVWVNIWSDTAKSGGDVQTDNQGRYEITGLDRNIKDYVISVIHEGYVSCFFSEKETVYKWEEADRIAPSESLDRNITLIEGFKIRGEITYNQETVAGVRIEAKSTETGETKTGISDSETSLNYQITGLLPGTYLVTVYPDSYMTQAHSVTITDQDVTLNFALEAKAKQSISGTVFVPETGKSVKIRVSSLSQGIEKSVFLKGTGEPLTYTVPDLTAASDYTVELISESYPYQVFDSKTKIDDADSVDISAADALNIDFTLKPAVMTEISGNIIFPADAVSGESARIEAYSKTAGARAEVSVTITDSQIVPYRLGGLLQAFDYALYISSDKYISHFYDGTDNGTQDEDNALLLDTLKNSVVFADFRLSRGASISGNVTDSQGKSVSGIRVEAWSLSSGISGYAVTSQSGNYSIQGLGFADDYTVKAYDKNLGTFFFNPEKTVMNEALAASVDTTNGNLYNISFILPELESISGTITDSTGSPLYLIWVEAYSGIMNVGGGVFTDNQGKYSVTGLPSGWDYTVSALS